MAILKSTWLLNLYYPYGGNLKRQLVILLEDFKIVTAVTKFMGKMNIIEKNTNSMII